METKATQQAEMIYEATRHKTKKEAVSIIAKKICEIKLNCLQENDNN